MTEPVVSMRAAAFGYGDRTVITGLDLDIPPGQILAVLGANGSGKSTLVKGLLRLSDQQHGTVTVFGEPLHRLTARHRLGYVPQRHSVASHDRATVQEVVAAGRLPYLPWHGRLRALDRRVVQEALAFVGLSGAAGAAISDLSGGQQRRVLIARALAAEPELLIMDEPTAGVDETNRAVLAEVMAALAGLGRTLIVVTHELSAIRHVVHRAIVLASGRVVTDAGPDALEGAMEHDDGHHHLETDRPLLPGVVGPLDGRADRCQRSWALRSCSVLSWQPC